tara:strand:- start:6614 stop:6772 length:159 start_codon:yes stop_codon:yes gene_type:complete
MEEKIAKLKTDLQQVTIKLEEFTQLKFKLLGAIEILESLDEESVEEKVEDGE